MCVCADQDGGDTSICHGNVCSGNGTYDTWCERCLRYPPENAVVIATPRPRQRSADDADRTPYVTQSSNYKSEMERDILSLVVECVEKRGGPSGRRTLYEIGTKEARRRRSRGSIHPRLVPQTAKSDGSRSEPKVHRRKSEFTQSAEVVVKVWTTTK